MPFFWSGVGKRHFFILVLFAGFISPPASLIQQTCFSRMDSDNTSNNTAEPETILFSTVLQKTCLSFAAGRSFCSRQQETVR